MWICYLRGNNQRCSGFTDLTVSSWKSYNWKCPNWLLQKQNFQQWKFLRARAWLGHRKRQGSGSDVAHTECKDTSAPCRTALALIKLKPSQALSWKVLTPEIMIYMGNGHSVAEPDSYLHFTEYALIKTERKEENTNTLSLSLSHIHTHINMSLCTYVNMDNFFPSPFWHKSLEQKMPSIMFKGFGVQLSGPAGQAHQGGIRIECCSSNNKITT